MSAIVDMKQQIELTALGTFPLRFLGSQGQFLGSGLTPARPLASEQRGINQYVTSKFPGRDPEPGSGTAWVFQGRKRGIDPMNFWWKYPTDHGGQPARHGQSRSPSIFLRELTFINIEANMKYNSPL
jgi:hypothetical protein